MRALSEWDRRTPLPRILYADSAGQRDECGDTMAEIGKHYYKLFAVDAAN